MIERRKRCGMHDYRIETKIDADGSVTIRGIPFQAGERVEVIIRGYESGAGNGERYPLRGTPVRYTDPYGSVGENDWDALQ
jgi:hypothetical protein